MMSVPPVLRFGVIGAARVVSYGLVRPAHGLADVTVAAVASRSLEKARAFATQHGIARAWGSYDQLLDDKSIDAVYIALPTALHAEWVQKALEAGKHVLCEKPLTTRAEVAEELVRMAGACNLVLQEGMHIRFLRKLHRQRALVTGGDLGRPLRIQSCFRVPKIPMAEGDFRLSFELGGGAALDLGCYAVTCLRYVAGGEPEVLSVRRRLAAPQVDRWMRAKCRLPSGVAGVVECGFRGWYSMRLGVEVTCERGSVKWREGGLAVENNGRVVHEAIPDDSTYQLQLQAFVASIRGQAPAVLPPEDAVANARVLDAMYAASGLAARPTKLAR
jgi:predicted dehydrogenase